MSRFDPFKQSKPALILFLIITLILTASCEGQNPDFEVYKLKATAKAAINRFGNEADAAYAILKAADKGYSIRQIVVGIHEKTLNKTGAIENIEPDMPGSTSSNDGTSKKSSKSTYALFDNLSAKWADGWIDWLLLALAEGYSPAQIKTMTAQSNNFRNRQIEPPTVRYNGRRYAVVFDGKKIVKPANFNSDWPFEHKDKVDEFLNGLATGIENAVIKTAASSDTKSYPKKSGRETFIIKLKLDPDYAKNKKLTAYKMIAFTAPDKNKLGGDFEITVAGRETTVTYRGRLLDRGDTSLIYPISFDLYGIDADFQVFINRADGSTAKKAKKKKSAFKGRIINKHEGSGTLVLGKARFIWQFDPFPPL